MKKSLSFCIDLPPELEGISSDDFEGKYCTYCQLLSAILHLLNYFAGTGTLRLISIIGQGNFGIVHKAIWRGSLVAAKVIQIPEGGTLAVNREIETCK